MTLDSTPSAENLTPGIGADLTADHSVNLLAEGSVYAVYAHVDGELVLEIRDMEHGAVAVLTGAEAIEFRADIEALKSGEIAVSGSFEATLDICAASFLVSN